MVTEDDLSSSGGHTAQCADNVSWKCTLETYMFLLTNITLVHSIKIGNEV